MCANSHTASPTFCSLRTGAQWCASAMGTLIRVGAVHVVTSLCCYVHARSCGGGGMENRIVMPGSIIHAAGRCMVEAVDLSSGISAGSYRFSEEYVLIRQWRQCFAARSIFVSRSFAMAVRSASSNHMQPYTVSLQCIITRMLLISFSLGCGLGRSAASSCFRRAPHLHRRPLLPLELLRNFD